MPIVLARRHDWPPGAGAACVPRNAAADAATDATVDGLGNAGGSHVVYHNESRLGNTLKMRETGHGETMSPRGGVGTLGSAVDFPSVFCYTGKRSAPAGSDEFY